MFVKAIIITAKGLPHLAELVHSALQNLADIILSFPLTWHCRPLPLWQTLCISREKTQSCLLFHNAIRLSMLGWTFQNPSPECLRLPCNLDIIEADPLWLIAQLELRFPNLPAINCYIAMMSLNSTRDPCTVAVSLSCRISRISLLSCKSLWHIDKLPVDSFGLGHETLALPL